MKKVLFGLSIACMLCTALVFDGCNGVDPFDPTSYCYKLTYTPTKGSDRGIKIVDYVWMNGDDLLSHKQWIETTYGVYPSHEKITGTSSKSECLAKKDGSSSQGGGGGYVDDDDPVTPPSGEFNICNGTWVSGSKYLEFYSNGTFKYWTSNFTAEGTYSIFGLDITFKFTYCDNPNYSEYSNTTKMGLLNTSTNKIEFLNSTFTQSY
jgi:hypothetical protein